MPAVSTTDEFWTWNGLNLNMPYWNIATIGGTRFALPTLRGQDMEIAYRSGKQWRAKYPDSRTITLVMWTAGIDQNTGNPAADQRLAWNNNWQQLRAAFWTRGLAGSQQGQLQRKWYITQQGATGIVTATAMAEIAGNMEPTMTGRTRADFSVDLLLSDPYFYGPAQSATIPRNVAQTLNNLGEGIVGEGYPSPVNAFTLTFNGQLTNPVLTNTTYGVSVSYGGVIPSGQSVVLDLLNFGATSAGVNVISNVKHSGARIWFGLDNGNNSVLLSTSASTDTGNVVLAWNPPYV
jgi:hypothetical protein